MRRNRAKEKSTFNIRGTVTITGYFSEFSSSHALLDITCKIAVTGQRSVVAFASSCAATCMTTRPTHRYRELNRNAAANRVVAH